LDIESKILNDSRAGFKPPMFGDLCLISEELAQVLAALDRSGVHELGLRVLMRMWHQERN